jgi:hypothetical protein
MIAPVDRESCRSEPRRCAPRRTRRPRPARCAPRETRVILFALLHVLEHIIELTEIFACSSSGYDSFLGIVSDVPFDKVSFSAAARSDRWRMDNVSIARTR